MGQQIIDYQKKLKNLNKLLPLVATGTVADCQSILDDTNRLLVKSGLNVLNTNPDLGLGIKNLLQLTGFSNKIESGYHLTSQDLGYVFSPILNSSGRMSHAKLSIESLLESSPELLKSKVSKLIATNEERKNLVKSILQGVESEAKLQVHNNSKLIWLVGDWSKGIVGLLASRLVNQHNLPVIVISSQPGFAECHASLRAPGGYHLPNIITSLESLLLKGGGHPGAAGFSALIQNLEEIKEKFTIEITNQAKQLDSSGVSYLPEWVTKKSINERPKNVDLHTLGLRKDLVWLQENEIDSNLLVEILALDPFGQDFPAPVVATQVILEKGKVVWLSGGKHLKFTLNNGLKVTAFNLSTEVKEYIVTNDNELKFWLGLKVSQNSWNNKTSLELIAESVWI